MEIQTIFYTTLLLTMVVLSVIILVFSAIGTVKSYKHLKRTEQPIKFNYGVLFSTLLMPITFLICLSVVLYLI